MSLEDTDNDLWESLTATLVLAFGLAALGVLGGSTIIMLATLILVGPIEAAKVASLAGVALCLFLGGFALVKP